MFGQYSHHEDPVGQRRTRVGQVIGLCLLADDEGEFQALEMPYELLTPCRCAFRPWGEDCPICQCLENRIP